MNCVPMIGSPPMPTAVRLPEALPRELVDGLVRQRARARDHADGAFGEDHRRHDADLALAGREDAGAVRADEADALLLHVGIRRDHVGDGDALGDADDDLDAGLGGLDDRAAGERRRDEDARRVRALALDSLAHRVVDRPVEVGLPALAGDDAGDDVRAVLDHLLGVEGAFFSGQALHDEPGVLVNEDAHSIADWGWG